MCAMCIYIQHSNTSGCSNNLKQIWLLSCIIHHFILKCWYMLLCGWTMDGYIVFFKRFNNYSWQCTLNKIIKLLYQIYNKWSSIKIYFSWIFAPFLRDPNLKNGQDLRINTRMTSKLRSENWSPFDMEYQKYLSIGEILHIYFQWCWSVSLCMWPTDHAHCPMAKGPLIFSFRLLERVNKGIACI